MNQSIDQSNQSIDLQIKLIDLQIESINNSEITYLGSVNSLTNSSATSLYEVEPLAWTFSQTFIEKCLKPFKKRGALGKIERVKKAIVSIVTYTKYYSKQTITAWKAIPSKAQITIDYYPTNFWVKDCLRSERQFDVKCNVWL